MQSYLHKQMSSFMKHAEVFGKEYLSHNYGIILDKYRTHHLIYMLCGIINDCYPELDEHISLNWNDSFNHINSGSLVIEILPKTKHMKDISNIFIDKEENEIKINF